MNQAEEAALINRAKTGDNQALEKLWDEFTPKLFGYLVNVTRDKVLAEDILQNTWLKALTALPKFQSRGKSIGGWLFAIAKNECRQQWRKAGREVPLDLKIHDVPQVDHNLENRLTVEKIIASLPADDQEILRLRYIADLSVGDIAKVLNLNFVTVRVRVHRAIHRARATLNS